MHNGNVARRAAGYDWRKPVPGWIKATEWGPYLPFDVYPQILNPPSGLLQNCNNPPWVVTRNSGLKPLEPAPYFLRPSEPRADEGEESLNTRGERLFQVLGRDKKFTLEEMIDLGFDTYVVPADVIVPCWTGPTRSSRSRACHGRSNTFAPGTGARRKTPLPTRSSISGARPTRNSSPANLGDSSRTGAARSTSIRKRSRGWPCARWWKSVARIAKNYGKPEVRWGDINVVVRGGTFPMDGTDLFGVLHPDEGHMQENGQIHCNDGWGHLLVVMEGQPKQVWSLLPYGQSEDPSSPHYNDQAKLHSERKVKRFWLTPEDILAHAQSVRGKRDRIRRIKQ